MHIDKKAFKLVTKFAEYEIPEDAFVIDGKSYNGKVDTFLYFFDENSVPPDLVSLDVFGEDGDFVGTSMASFGMPYVQFYSPDHKRIDVLSSNPMRIKMKMLHSDYLVEKILPEKFDLLLRQSKKSFITQKFISDNFILDFPVF